MLVAEIKCAWNGCWFGPEGLVCSSTNWRTARGSCELRTAMVVVAFTLGASQVQSRRALKRVSQVQPIESQPSSDPNQAIANTLHLTCDSILPVTILTVMGSQGVRLVTHFHAFCEVLHTCMQTRGKLIRITTIATIQDWVLRNMFIKDTSQPRQDAACSQKTCKVENHPSRTL